MEILATKIAELLDVTIEQAVLLYPILRQQFIWYKILASLQVILVIPIVSLGMFTIISIIDYSNLQERLNNRLYRDEVEVNKLAFKKKIVIKFTICTICLLGVFFITMLLTYILSPDLMIILRFLN
jgi:hypothetical protein